MNVLVVGGSGFLGSHVADALSDAGHAVSIYDREQSPYLRVDQHMVIGDVRDTTALTAAARGCEVVYHFAAIADIDAADNDPVGTTDVNVLGTVRLLEACRTAGVRRFVFASSIYVYSDRGSFYRCSKQACELFIEEYHKRYGLAYTIVRYGSLYGTRATADNWIHSMLQQALQEKRIVRRGAGEEIREYINVIDAAASSVQLLAPEFANTHLILTGSTPIKIKDLLAMVREMLGNTIDIVYTDAAEESHYTITPYVYRPRAARKLVANPHIDLGQGLLECLHEIDESMPA